MKVRLTLMRPGGAAEDITVTAEPGSTIGEIAARIGEVDPQAATTPGAVTLRRHVGPAAQPGDLIDPAAALGDSELASGATVSLAAPGSTAAGAAPAAATVTILDGPDAGATIAIPAGTSSIGRDPAGRVVLTDPLVSKVHARINVTDLAEVIDAGSANGTLVNGQSVDRAVLVAGDRITVGDTVLGVAVAATQGAQRRAGIVRFNRSPRLDPRYPGGKLIAPEPPERPKPPRLPYLAVVAPLILGAVLLVANPGNPLSVVFIALSPVLLVATFIDGRLQARAQWRQAREQFGAAVSALDERIDGLHLAERDGRLAEAPSVDDVVAAASDYGSLLWTRRPEHDAYLTLRLGLGTMPSRHELELPGNQKGTPEMWAELARLAAKTATVDDVPVTENLRESGSIGIGGPLDAARSVGRGVVAQLVSLHSPAELSVAAVTSSLSARSWDWLKWLPHAGGPMSAIEGPALVTGGAPALGLIAELEGIVATRSEQLQGDNGSTLPTVVLLVEDDAPVERARLVGLAESGPAVGVHLLWIAGSTSRLPAACRTFLELGAIAEDSLAGFVRTGAGVRPVRCVALDEVAAMGLARSLAPVVDDGARVDDASDLPRAVSLLHVIGTDVASQTDAVIQRWQETNSILTGPRATTGGSHARPNLRAVFGQAATEPFALDLRADGPHALVGGTTGSGKSEFLQAWVLALATAHSPQRVSFLFVDYKGGAAFADCLELPHTVGLVTDLSPHLVRRALTSLRAELRYREHLFNRKKVKDIIEFERLGDPEVPPSLVIVVDEFAALATEVPEFVDGVVDVAQRGRSLGLHLILATQRPAGVIRDNLRANTNLRVALRMADEADSDDVLGSNMAAGFDPALPGRGAAKTGPGRLRVFQSGYAGGWTTDEPEPTEVTIEELSFGPPVVWQAAVAAPRRDPSGPNDIKRTVTTIRSAARAAELPAPRKPWLPELASAYDFSKLPNRRTDTELLLGVVDDASTQSQPVVAYHPDRDGNMAVIGTGGSGKSTALRTIAVSSAITMRGGPVQVYGLDFAAGGLQMIETLPHVGAVISGDDEERVARLLRRLRDLVDDRAVRFSEARAGNIVDYRKLASRPDEARILLLLDGMGAFRDAYEASVTSPWFSMFSQIATDGRAVGVHVIVSGDRAGAIPTSLSSSIQRRLVLRLATADDYTLLGVESDVLSSASPPGRGILDGREMQIAVLGGDGNVALQAREMDALAESMTRAGIPAAPTVERLPDDIPLGSLGRLTGGLVPIGIADDTLQTIGIEPSGPFVIAGPPGSGRTSALETVARSLAASHPATKRYLLSGRRSPLTGIDGLWTAAADSPDETSKLLGLLAALDPKEPAAVVLEHLSDLGDGVDEYELERVVKQLLKQGAFVIGESETSAWRNAYTVGQHLRAGRRGILLQPDDGDGDTLLSTSLGRVRRSTIPPGGGYLVEKGRLRRLQLAHVAAT